MGHPDKITTHSLTYWADTLTVRGRHPGKRSSPVSEPGAPAGFCHAAVAMLRGWDAHYWSRSRGGSVPDGGRKRAVRSVDLSGVLRFVVSISRQRLAGLGRNWTGRLPLRQSPAP